MMYMVYIRDIGVCVVMYVVLCMSGVVWCVCLDDWECVVECVSVVWCVSCCHDLAIGINDIGDAFDEADRTWLDRESRWTGP